MQVMRNVIIVILSVGGDSCSFLRFVFNGAWCWFGHRLIMFSCTFGPILGIWQDVGSFKSMSNLGPCANYPLCQYRQFLVYGINQGDLSDLCHKFVFCPFTCSFQGGCIDRFFPRFRMNRWLRKTAAARGLLYGTEGLHLSQKVRSTSVVRHLHTIST